MLMAGDIDMGHARALLSLDRAAQITVGNQIAAKKLSVREAEALVKRIGADFSLVPQSLKRKNPATSSVWKKSCPTCSWPMWRCA